MSQRSKEMTVKGSRRKEERLDRGAGDAVWGGGGGVWAVAEIARSGRELLRQGGLRDSGSLHQALRRQSQVCCASLWLTHPKA